MSGLPDWVKDAGKGLGELDADERQKMLKAINQIALAQAPDETVAAPPIRTLGDYLDWEIELPPIDHLPRREGQDRPLAEPHRPLGARPSALRQPRGFGRDAADG
jgi:hypothetical protein